jgi:hypothetical protein
MQKSGINNHDGSERSLTLPDRGWPPFPAVTFKEIIMSKLKVRNNKVLVCDVTWEGVVVAVNGKNRHITWADLRAAAAQEDNELRKVYSDILSVAKGIASRRKAVEIWLEGSGTAPYEARMCDMAGEHVPGRLVSAAWGAERGFYMEDAVEDAHEAEATLRQRGYEVICNVRGYRPRLLLREKRENEAAQRRWQADENRRKRRQQEDYLDACLKKDA